MEGLRKRGRPVGKRIGEGKRLTLRLREGVDESLVRSYEECRVVRRSGAYESLNDYLNRILFEKSEELLMVSRRSRELREAGDRILDGRSVDGKSLADLKLERLRREARGGGS